MPEDITTENNNIEEQIPKEPERFKDISKEGQRIVNDLEILTLRHAITKVLYGLLTDEQKTDLTDSGATTLHKHDHGGLDGLADKDHAAYIAKDGSTSDVSSDIPLNTNKLTGVKDPTANQDAATKKYVDDNMWSFNEYFRAGDNLLWSDDTTENENNGTPVKHKAQKIQAGGTLRIKFDLRKNVDGTAYGRVYKDGSPVGTEQDTTSSTFVTFSEDIAGWEDGDDIELWIWYSGTDFAYVENFRVYYKSPSETASED